MMPLILEPPPVDYAAEASLLYALDDAPPPSGSDGLALVEHYRHAFVHWQDRPSNAPAVASDDKGVGHVPLRKIGTMKVRFKSPQPMKPRSVNFDLEEYE